MTQQEKKPDNGSWARALQDAGPFLGFGVGAAAAILLGLAGGYWLDGKLGTRPLCFLLGGLFGLAAAGYNFYLTVIGRQR
jgi:F0F1-type ATP synthase assembly protein I